jgi:hypothetical protein
MNANSERKHDMSIHRLLGATDNDAMAIMEHEAL